MPLLFALSSICGLGMPSRDFRLQLFERWVAPSATLQLAMVSLLFVFVYGTIQC